MTLGSTPFYVGKGNQEKSVIGNLFAMINVNNVMMKFCDFFNLVSETDQNISPEKRSVLLSIKDVYKKFSKYTAWIVALHAGVMNDTISLSRATAALSQLSKNGLPSTFADVHNIVATNKEYPKYVPDKRLSVIRKPQMLGSNPNLSGYVKTDVGYQRI